jgi:hypothetical protein
MESQLDLILTLVPIALVIALRLYASRKKKAEDEERARLGKFLAKVASGEAKSAPVLSTRNLISDEDDGDEDEEYSEAPARFYGRSVLQTANYKGPEVALVAEPILPSAGPSLQVGPMGTQALVNLERARQATQPRGVDVRNSRSSDRFFARLEKLSPLKRAVVMAELLGRPKGM